MLKLVYVVIAAGAQAVILGAVSLTALATFPAWFGEPAGDILAIALFSISALWIAEFIAREGFGRVLFGLPLANSRERLTVKLLSALALWVVIGIVAYQLAITP